MLTFCQAIESETKGGDDDEGEDEEGEEWEDTKSKFGGETEWEDAKSPLGEEA